MTSNEEIHTNEEVQVYVHDLHIFFVTVQLLEDTPAVLSLWPDFAMSTVTRMSDSAVESRV